MLDFDKDDLNTLFLCSYRDFEEFLDDLEEDPGLRKNVNIFKAATAVDYNDADFDPTAPRITLEEMLDDMNIEDEEMEE